MGLQNLPPEMVSSILLAAAMDPENIEITNHLARKSYSYEAPFSCTYLLNNFARTASEVCTQWRQLIINNARQWCLVVILINQKESDTENAIAQITDSMKCGPPACAMSCDNCNMYIHIQTCFSRSSLHPSAYAYMHLCRFLISHSHRLCAINISVTEIPGMEPMFEETLHYNRLTCLHLGWHCSDPHLKLRLAKVAPYLWKFDGSDIPLSDGFPPNLRVLRLDQTMRMHPLDSFIDALRSCPQLEELHMLCSPSVRQETEEREQEAPVSLKSLKVMYLFAKISFGTQLISRLALPSLHTLTLYFRAAEPGLETFLETLTSMTGPLVDFPCLKELKFFPLNFITWKLLCRIQMPQLLKLVVTDSDNFASPKTDCDELKLSFPKLECLELELVARTANWFLSTIECMHSLHTLSLNLRDDRGVVPFVIPEELYLPVRKLRILEMQYFPWRMDVMLQSLKTITELEISIREPLFKYLPISGTLQFMLDYEREAASPINVPNYQSIHLFAPPSDFLETLSLSQETVLKYYVREREKSGNCLPRLMWDSSVHIPERLRDKLARCVGQADCSPLGPLYSIS